MNFQGSVLAITIAIAGALTGMGGQDETDTGGPVLIIEHRETGECREIPLDDYVAGVVMAEVPYTFPGEALMAQAAAARTYTLFCIKAGAKPHDSGADVCDDPSHCAGWESAESMAARFGDAYAGAAWEACRAAAYDTAGQVLTWEGEPICAVWHASSAGRTESAKALWGGDAPCLTSVGSPEEAERSQVILAIPELRRILAGRGWNGSLQTSLIKNESGRCDVFTLGNLTLTGQEARTVFGLKSTAFTAMRCGDRLIFTAAGYGHGVGLSQRGAEAMARAGADWREIVLHYYAGCAVTKANSP